MLGLPGRGAGADGRAARAGDGGAERGRAAAPRGARAAAPRSAPPGLPVGLASNSSREFVERALAVSALADGHFDVVVSADDVEAPKPAPDLYLAACAALGAAPERAAALEDSPPGVASARAAGMYVIAVPYFPDTVIEGASLERPLARRSERGGRPGRRALGLGGHSAAARPPVLGQVGVLEEEDVVVGARRGDRVPDGVSASSRSPASSEMSKTPTSSGSPTSASSGSAAARLLARLPVARGAAVKHQHRDSLREPCQGIPSLVLASAADGSSEREGSRLPRPPRGRAVRHPQPLGRRVGAGARGARLQGARHDQLRLRLHARPPRRQRHPRRGRRARARALDAATELPISVDLENGYGPDPEHAATRDRCASRRRARWAARSRTRPGRRAVLARARGGAVAAAAEAAQRPRLPVHADRPRGEPHPRRPGPRRHDRAPAGLRARRAPTSSSRPACAAGTRSGRSATPSRSRSTCSPSAGHLDERDRRGGRAARQRRRRRWRSSRVGAAVAAAEQIRDTGDFSALGARRQLRTWLGG